MRPFLLAILIGLVPIKTTRAAESEVRIPTVVFSEESSFETLRTETYVPSQAYLIDSSRGMLLDSLKWNTPFPLNHFGYPSGQLGVRMGGRSSEDSQTSTLGIPLNLPQGGGSDLSAFPGYLWDSVILGATPTGAGITPQSVSGSIELIPWTRAVLGADQAQLPASRFTVSMDPDLQSVSIGTRKSDIAVLAGMSSGKTKGPAGSLSYPFLRTPQLTITAHVIGADQEGEAPDPAYSAPDQRKKTTRILPVLESQLSLNSESGLKTTLFGDLLKYDFINPTYSQHTEQYGIQNVAYFRDTLLTVTARSVQFQNPSGTFSEWPFYSALTQGFTLDPKTQMKVTANAEYVSGMGLHPGGRISAEHQAQPKMFFFSELYSLPKLPTLIERNSLFTHYHGNPGLQPERVHAFLFGLKDQSHVVKSTTTLKAEYRTSVFVDTANTTKNEGNAMLLSAQEALSAPVSTWLQVGLDTAVTYSKIQTWNTPYPDLPFLSLGGRLNANPTDLITLETQVKWMGPSTAAPMASTPATSHPDYGLVGQNATLQWNPDLKFTLGIDNLLNSPAEAVLGYPLPGRRVYFGAESRF